MPGRGGQGPAGRTSPGEATTRATGKIEKIDEKSIVIQAEDGRTIQFQRSKDTRFYKESKEIPASELKAGDRVTVEATEDQRGRLYARSVYPGAARVGPAGNRFDQAPGRAAARPGRPRAARAEAWRPREA